MSIKWQMQVILSEALPLTASQNWVTTCIYVTNAKTVRAGWNNVRWREISGIICDKKVPDVLKHNIYKTAIRPAMTYGGEYWAIRKVSKTR